MQQEEYQNIFLHEETHWWYRFLHEVVLDTIKNVWQEDKSISFILDGGCGTGGLIKVISKVFPSWHLVGLDISYYALAYCKKNGLRNLSRASVEHLPFTDESLNIVISTDVLYHLQVNNDETALAEIYRVLKRGGYLILHLPAFEFLKGTHDRVVHTRNRYKMGQLQNKVERAGFKITMCTYRHIILFLVLFFLRWFERKRTNIGFHSDLKTLPVWLNSLLSIVSYCENKLIKHFRLPFGSSLFCLGMKIR